MASALEGLSVEEREEALQAATERVVAGLASGRVRRRNVNAAGNAQVQMQLLFPALPYLGAGLPYLIVNGEHDTATDLGEEVDEVSDALLEDDDEQEEDEAMPDIAQDEGIHVVEVQPRRAEAIRPAV